VLDGKWARQQAADALATFVAPVKGVASFVMHGPRGSRGEHASAARKGAHIDDKYRKS
jgi:hypothetical protein